MKKILNFYLLIAFLMLSYTTAQGTCGEIVPFASEPVVDGCNVTYEMDLSIGVNWILYPGNGLPQSASVSSATNGSNVYTHTYQNAQGVIYPNIRYFDANWNFICSSFYPVTINCGTSCTTPPTLDCSIKTSQGTILSSCQSTTCAGDCVVLSLTEPGFNPANYTYVWSSNTPVNAAPNNWYTQSICTSDIYSVTITDAQGCTQVRDFDISIVPLPNITLSQDGPLTCDNPNVTINTNSSGYCYQWSDGSSNSSLTVNAHGQYCVTVSDCVTGCAVELCEDVVADQEAPDLDCSILDPDDNSVLANNCSYAICEGECVILSVNGNEDYTYSWSPVVGNNNEWFSDKICEAGIYTVTITAANGCQQVKTFDITTVPLPVVTLTSNGPISCEQPEVTITATEGYCYEWSDGLGNDKTATVTNAGEYCVTVSDCNSICQTIKCITIEEEPDAFDVTCYILQPFPFESASETVGIIEQSCEYTLCGDECITLSVGEEPMNTGYTYNWESSLGYFPFNGEWVKPKLCEPGNYSVTVTNQEGCSIVKTFTITSTESPTLEITVDGEIDCNMVETVTLSATFDANYEYFWNQNLGTNPEVEVLDPGEYCVTVTDVLTGCRASECVNLTGGSFCNVGSFDASAEINGVQGGGPYLFADGLLEGESLCWEFEPNSVPDYLIITIGGIEVVNTGNVAGLSSSDCNDPQINYCDCVDYFLGDYSDGDCIDLVAGSALVTQDEGDVDPIAQATISGSILITPDLACKEISVTIGNDCGEDINEIWDASLYCCDYPVECFDGYFPPVTNGYCRTNDVGTSFLWDAVPDAVGYIITIDQGNSECCPTVAPANFAPINIEVSQNFFVLPDDLPECFNWYVQAVGPNGEVSAPGPLKCFNDAAVCQEVYDLEPCENPEAPGPVSCDVVANGLQLTWPAQPVAVAYTVVVNVGPSACCPDIEESSTSIFQTTRNELILPRDFGECFTYTIFSVCEDYTASPVSEPYCVDDIWNCNGKEEGPKGRSQNFDTLSSNANFEAYPNPAKDRVNVLFNALQEGQLEIQLRSIDGRLMNTMVSQISKGENIVSMTTEKIPSGIYFLQIETKQQKVFKKVVIQK